MHVPGWSTFRAADWSTFRAARARLEFKEAKQNYHFEKLLEYCVALANEGGGRIIFGVTDNRPRRIVGTAAFAEPGRTEAGIHDRLLHRVPIEEMHTAEGRVVIVHVPPRIAGTAWNLDGRFLKRAGDGVVPIGDTELRALFAEAGPDFSAEICAGASVADLSAEAVKDFVARWAARTRDDRKTRWRIEEALANAELTIDGRLTYASLILFGTRSSLGRFLAQSELVFEYRPSEASGTAADRHEFREGFFLWQNEIWRLINLRNESQSYQDGLFRIDLPAFDEVAVREVLLNAIAHRDYRSGASIFVRQYATRLEVVSPGGLPAGITTSNILDQQNPRNRRLAEALGKCGLIERSGQGMNLIFESAVRQGKPLPSFAGTADHQVSLTLHGVLQNPQFVRFIEQLGQEVVRSFSTDDFLALNGVYLEQALSDRQKARMPGLVAAGAVESLGRGRGVQYFLSKRFHAALGQMGTYTRRRGLDRATKKALVEQHLKEQEPDGAGLAELKQVIPAESESGVQSLLNELRQEGRVELRGRRRWARWFIRPA